MRQHFMIILKFDPEHGSREDLTHNPDNLDFLAAFCHWN